MGVPSCSRRPGLRLQNLRENNLALGPTPPGASYHYVELRVAGPYCLPLPGSLSESVKSDGIYTAGINAPSWKRCEWPLRTFVPPSPSSTKSPFEPPPSGISAQMTMEDRKSTRLNSSHITISYAVFCLKKKKKTK